MAVHHYVCTQCEHRFRVFRGSSTNAQVVNCKKCEALAVRDAQGGEPVITERVDNGMMPVALTRWRDGAEVYHDRARGKKKTDI